MAILQGKKPSPELIKHMHYNARDCPRLIHVYENFDSLASKVQAFKRQKTANAGLQEEKLRHIKKFLENKFGPDSEKAHGSQGIQSQAHGSQGIETQARGSQGIENHAKQLTATQKRNLRKRRSQKQNDPTSGESARRHSSYLSECDHTVLR